MDVFKDWIRGEAAFSPHGGLANLAPKVLCYRKLCSGQEPTELEWAEGVEVFRDELRLCWLVDQQIKPIRWERRRFKAAELLRMNDWCGRGMAISMRLAAHCEKLDRAYAAKHPNRPDPPLPGVAFTDDPDCVESYILLDGNHRARAAIRGELDGLELHVGVVQKGLLLHACIHVPRNC